MKYEENKHSWGKAWVRSDLKGKHQEHCLCFACKKFKPCAVDNCHIAQATFKNCQQFNTVTPVWECPEFAEGEPDLNGMKT